MNYNTDINSFGGIQDYHMIHESLRSYFNGENDLKKRFVEDNIFGIRTEEGRGRFYRGIKSSILTFQNSKHEDIYRSFFSTLNQTLPYNLLIFWQLSINNKLFNVISKELYLKYYFNGKVTITGHDVFYFLQDLKERDEDFKNQNWTKKTTEPVASKYLTILRKLNFVEGVQKKHLIHVQISDQEFAVFLHLLVAIYGEGTNFLNHDFNGFSFVSNESFNERVKRVAQKGFIGMAFSGTKLSLQPIFKLNELADGIFGRS
ncbi:BrxA family protein [Winogradskyella sp. ECml5-4]|uniref:BrxA family protein n=1 Tax=Winogradskyella sp. ECml5-4 TaxID=3110975 RepID=UPI002FEEA9BE